MDTAFENLQRDTNATIKAILSDMEALARLTPDRALNPEIFGEYRKNVVRRVWALSRRCLATLDEDIR